MKWKAGGFRFGGNVDCGKFLWLVAYLCTGKLNSRQGFIFNLGVPHVCLLLANMGPRSENKSFTLVFGIRGHGWAPILAKAARNWAPQDCNIHLRGAEAALPSNSTHREPRSV